MKSGDTLYTAVVEKGFSESYGDLVNDARLWLEGNHEVRMVILIKIKEDPKYQNPIQN